MNILLTGATGLIGKQLVNKLLSSKATITALTRDVKSAKNKLGDQLNFISSLDNLDDLNSFDACINLAGEAIADKRWSDEQKSEIENSRWNTTQRITDLIDKSESPPKVFISGSAIGFYGRQGSEPITEEFDRPHQEFSHRLCAKWEDIALNAQSDSTRVCILRTGIVLSNEGGAISKLLVPFKLGLGGPIGNGQHFMPWIHIEDMVDGIMFLLNNPDCSGVFNFTAPNPVNNLQFSKTLAKTLHRPCLFPTPPFMLKLMFGEMADLLIYGQNVVPEKLLNYGYSFHYSELKPALENLLQ